MQQNLSILSAMGRARFILEHSKRELDNFGGVRSIDPGARVETEPFDAAGSSIPHAGISNSLLGGRARGRITVANAVGRINDGFRARRMDRKITEEEVLDYFFNHPRNGIDFCVVDEGGNVVSAEDSRLTAEERERNAPVDDDQYLRKLDNGNYYCEACEVEKPGRGIHGHKRSHAHLQKVNEKRAAA